MYQGAGAWRPSQQRSLGKNLRGSGLYEQLLPSKDLECTMSPAFHLTENF